jgi:translation elongation factor EF-Tu-like GTPase
MNHLAQTIGRPADIEGVFHLFGSGGRSAPAFSDYRPAHRLHENYFSSGVHEYLDSDRIHPGESRRVAVWLITPHVYPACLWEGREIGVYEGEHSQVGLLRVTEVRNPILRGTPERYKSVWTIPPGLEEV